MARRFSGSRRGGTLHAQSGVTLIELVVVISIMGILAAMATLGFKRMRDNSAIDAQTKEIYSDLMKARSEAVFMRTNRSVVIDAGCRLSVYSSANGAGTALWQHAYSYAQPIAASDSAPLALDANGAAAADKAYCIGAAGNGAGVDSIVISTTSIMVGKLNGGSCSSGNIDPK